jgi:WD40 repeat protein
LIGDSSKSVLVGCCTYNHNGQLLVAGATDGVVRIFDIRKGECVDSWLAHDGSVLSLQLSVDFTSCFTLGQDGKVIKIKAIFISGYFLRFLVLSTQFEPVWTQSVGDNFARALSFWDPWTVVYL